jgi:hypothetical protein
MCVQFFRKIQYVVWMYSIDTSCQQSIDWKLLMSSSFVTATLYSP